MPIQKPLVRALSAYSRAATRSAFLIVSVASPGIIADHVHEDIVQGRLGVVEGAQGDPLCKAGLQDRLALGALLR